MKSRLGGALAAGVLLTAQVAMAQLPVGTAAPEFTLKDPEGQAVSLSQFHGRRYVLLDFWASWCPHCKHAMPQLRSLQDKYQSQLVVLGVNAGESPAEGAAAAKRLGLNFPVLLRGDQLMEQYMAPGFPTTYLIDPDGRIAEAQVGANPDLWSRVEAVVARYQPPAADEREGLGSPRKAAQIGHALTFPMPPGPHEWLVGRDVVIRFTKPEGLSAELVSLSLDGKQLAIFGVGAAYTWDATRASEGPHKLRLSAQTASGRENWAAEQVVIVDNRPPVDEAAPVVKSAPPTKPTTQIKNVKRSHKR